MDHSKRKSTKLWLPTLQALRPHQWSKNLLLFVHIFMAHQLNNSDQLLNTLIGFLAFCLCASSVYITNDLLDLTADQHHPDKKNRPFAAGRLTRNYGISLSLILLLTAMLVASTLSRGFIITITSYYLVTLAYSVYLKKSPIVDVLLLAILYTLRVIAGAAIISEMPSFWLMAFSMFLFMSLAVVKRYSELLSLQDEGGIDLGRRGYQLSDVDTLSSIGTTCGLLAVLVLALYINSTHIQEMYSRPEAIGLLCPLLMYWISRIWLLARRGELHQDPVVFAITDIQSYAIALTSVIIIWAAL
jgi:4-hydroxybenzoate polyprenyltransferase